MIYITTEPIDKWQSSTQMENIPQLSVEHLTCVLEDAASWHRLVSAPQYIASVTPELLKILPAAQI